MEVLLVDDHALFVAAMRNLLETNGISIVGTARDGQEALEQVRMLHPDIVLMDIYMPGCDGVEATRLIKDEYPGVQVVMLTMAVDDDNLFRAIQNGASGYIAKDVQVSVLLDLLVGVARGEAAITLKTASRIMGEFVRTTHNARPVSSTPGVADRKRSQAGSELSARQIEILRLMAEGHTYKMIAARLFISERTVNYHVAEMLNKLQLRSRAQIIAYATHQGLLGVSDTGSKVSTKKGHQLPAAR